MHGSLFSLTALAVFLVTSVAAQAGPYQQCGGNGFPATACTSGNVCNVVNEWYHQCIPGTGGVTSKPPTTPATSAPGTTPTNTPTAGCSAGSLTRFKYFGVNEAGAEFGTAKPGVRGVDYEWPATSSIDYFMSKGLTTIRVPFLVERLSPNFPSGAFAPAYLSELKATIQYVTNKGGYAVLDPHNYFRYNGQQQTASDFAAWWVLLAREFSSNDRIVFDLQNEPNGYDASVVFTAMQTAVNAIRSSGATRQLILVEGTSWSGAHSWISSGNGVAFAKLKDPSNNIAITMHQYLDSDSSGTNTVCTSATIGSERIAAATAWLKQNNFKAILGEFGGGDNPTCLAAIKDLMCTMQQPGSPWIGAIWWAAGPWWGDYFLSIEPGSTHKALNQALLPFV